MELLSWARLKERERERERWPIALWIERQKRRGKGESEPSERWNDDEGETSTKKTRKGKSNEIHPHPPTIGTRKFRINNYFPRIRIIRVEENRFTSDKIHIKFSKHPFILHELFYRNENVSF